MATLGIEVLQCPRLVHGNAVFENVGILWSFMNAFPRDESWQSQAFSHYSYDLLVTDSGAAAALLGAGLPTHVATMRADSINLPTSQVQETWRFNATNLAYEVTFRHSAESGTILPGGGNLTRSMWLGTGPFLRFDSSYRDTFYEFNGLDVGTVSMTGSSEFMEAAIAGNREYRAETIHTLFWTINGESKTYGS